jgi:decaprenylphospho-beta-D-erythro-pentofuranosid-2-ulose 2-reductase
VFDRVILFGGTSEIGLRIARAALFYLGSSQLSAITRVLRSNPSESEASEYKDVLWSPTSSEEVTSTVTRLAIGPKDLAVISIGDLSLDDFTAKELAQSVKQVEGNLYSNGTLPILTLLAVADSMIKAGGGEIVVVSSAAAFPVLDSNSIYSASKLMLDEVSQSIAGDLEKHQIRILLVRPGFVPTKLHRRRSRSFLSTSAEEISNVVIKKLNRNSYGVAWIPKSWALVSWTLTFLPFTRRIASRLMRNLRFKGK